MLAQGEVTMSSDNHVVNLKKKLKIEDFQPLKRIGVSGLRADALHRKIIQNKTIISSTVFAIFVGGTSTVTVTLSNSKFSSDLERKVLIIAREKERKCSVVCKVVFIFEKFFAM